MRTQDIEAATATLVAAFDRDPLSQWLFPDRPDRLTGLNELFTHVLRDLKPGAIVEVTESLDGVAVWYPPDTPYGDGETADEQEATAQFFKAIADAAPQQPYWYLAFLGSLTVGTGVGVALLRHRLAVTSERVALWTGNEHNKTYYAKFGFETVAECSAGGASAWWMMKEGL